VLSFYMHFGMAVALNRVKTESANIMRILMENGSIKVIQGERK